MSTQGIEESGIKEEEQSPYRAFLATREKILKFKWVESEKAGRDIGFEAALLGWANAGNESGEPGKR